MFAHTEPGGGIAFIVMQCGGSLFDILVACQCPCHKIGISRIGQLKRVRLTPFDVFIGDMPFIHLFSLVVIQI